MGMYTHCRGWIELRYDTMDTDKFNDLMAKAEELSTRAHFCVCSTTFNIGSNGMPYIFIGGELKNYDDDWDTFLFFLLREVDFDEYSIETKYEEDCDWREFKFVESEVSE